MDKVNVMKRNSGRRGDDGVEITVNIFDHDKLPDDIRDELRGIDLGYISEDDAKSLNVALAFSIQENYGIYLVKEHVMNMPDKALKFVIMHEACHILNPCATEIECDKYAIERFGMEAYEEAIRYTKELKKSLGFKPKFNR